MMCGLMLGIASVQAQERNVLQENNIFQHLGVGIGIGTTGVTFDLGTDVTDYVTVRAGLDFFPNIKADFDLKTGFETSYDKSKATAAGYSLPNGDIKIQGKTNLTTGHLLFDIHPFKNSIRVTTGLYFGSSKIITVENKNNAELIGVANWNADVSQLPGGPLAPLAVANGGTLPRIGVEMGDYFLAPDNNGHVDACIKVNSVRPYLGIGFGRLVPKNSRLTCNFDLGVQFWGKPEVYLNGIDGEKKLEKSDIDGKGSDALDYLSKVTVYPSLTVRLVGRIF